MTSFAILFIKDLKRYTLPSSPPCQNFLHGEGKAFLLAHNIALGEIRPICSTHSFQEAHVTLATVTEIVPGPIAVCVLHLDAR